MIGLLSDRHRFEDIDRLVTEAPRTGFDAADLTVATALTAIRNKEYEAGLTLARQVFPTTSTRFGDHLNLGRMLLPRERTRGR